MPEPKTLIRRTAWFLLTVGTGALGWVWQFKMTPSMATLTFRLGVAAIAVGTTVTVFLLVQKHLESPLMVKILWSCFVGCGLGLLSYYVFEWTTSSAESSPTETARVPDSAVTVDPVPMAVERLKPYASEYSNIRILMWSNAHRTLANRIASTFQLAGWEVDQNTVAQEAHNPHYFEGIEVLGYNSELVKVAAEAVTAVGGWDVRTHIKEFETPQGLRAEQTIQVTVGYPQSP